MTLIGDATITAASASLSSSTIAVLNGSSIANTGADSSTLIFALGNLSNNSSDNSLDTITIRYTAQVDNSPDDGDTLDNSAQFGWDKGAGLVFDTAVSDSLAVLEPVLDISKTINSATSGVDAGDSVEYTITIQHADSSSTDAFDLSLTDLIPAEITSLTILNSPTDSEGILVNTSDYSFTGQTLGFTSNLATFAQGRVLTVTVRGVIQDSAEVEEIISNKARTDYSSTLGVNAHEKHYFDESTTVTTTLSSPEILQFISTAETIHTLDDEAGNVDDDDEVNDASKVTDYVDKDIASSGEIVSVLLKIKMPEGTLPDLVLTSVLASGMTYNGNAIASDADGNLIDLSGKITNGGASGDDVVFNLGDVVNSFASAGDYLTITFDTKVDSAAADGSSYAISSKLGYTGKDGSNVDTARSLSTSADSIGIVGIVTPDLDISKTINSATSGVDAGDSVEYTITLQHNASSTASAFDVAITDALPAHLGSLTVVSTSDSEGILINAADYDFTNNTLSLTAPISSFAQGRVISVTVSGIIQNAAEVEEILSNQASVATPAKVKMSLAKTVSAKTPLPLLPL
jgi:fimbrial isopeptide formation D2 family protein